MSRCKKKYIVRCHQLLGLSDHLPENVVSARDICSWCTWCTWSVCTWYLCKNEWTWIQERGGVMTMPAWYMLYIASLKAIKITVIFIINCWRHHWYLYKPTTWNGPAFLIHISNHNFKCFIDFYYQINLLFDQYFSLHKVIVCKYSILYFIQKIVPSRICASWCSEQYDI